MEPQVKCKHCNIQLQKACALALVCDGFDISHPIQSLFPPEEGISRHDSRLALHLTARIGSVLVDQSEQSEEIKRGKRRKINPTLGIWVLVSEIIYGLMHRLASNKSPGPFHGAAHAQWCISASAGHAIQQTTHAFHIQFATSEHHLVSLVGILLFYGVGFLVVRFLQSRG